jgi:hypothetical protein
VQCAYNFQGVQCYVCSVCIVQMSCDSLCAECFSAPFASYTNSAQCSVPRQCAMCVQQARWALLSMLGVHCANVVCVLLCAGCFSAQAALCTNCVQCPIPVQCLCTHLVGCATLGVHSENSPHPKCNCYSTPTPTPTRLPLVLSVCRVHCVHYTHQRWGPPWLLGPSVLQQSVWYSCELCALGLETLQPCFFFITFGDSVLTVPPMCEKFRKRNAKPTSNFTAVTKTHYKCIPFDPYVLRNS